MATSTGDSTDLGIPVTFRGRLASVNSDKSGTGGSIWAMVSSRCWRASATRRCQTPVDIVRCVQSLVPPAASTMESCCNANKQSDLYGFVYCWGQVVGQATRGPICDPLHSVRCTSPGSRQGYRPLILTYWPLIADCPTLRATCLGLQHGAKHNKEIIAVSGARFLTHPSRLCFVVE